MYEVYNVYNSTQTKQNPIANSNRDSEQRTLFWNLDYSMSVHPSPSHFDKVILICKLLLAPKLTLILLKMYGSQNTKTILNICFLCCQTYCTH